MTQTLTLEYTPRTGFQLKHNGTVVTNGYEMEFETNEDLHITSSYVFEVDTSVLCSGHQACLTRSNYSWSSVSSYEWYCIPNPTRHNTITLLCTPPSGRQQSHTVTILKKPKPSMEKPKSVL
jgi:hypothetical protein